MRLIIGGRAQGKCTFLLKENQYTIEQICDGAVHPLEETIKKPVLNHLHIFVRRWLEAGKSADKLYPFLTEGETLKVILCDEIGSGIVPIDPKEEAWREATGRLCCMLAERSERVDRVFCQIGTRLKG